MLKSVNLSQPELNKKITYQMAPVLKDKNTDPTPSKLPKKNLQHPDTYY